MQNFQFLENINNKFTDIFFSIRGEQKPSNQIVIVDIDEKSLTYMKGFSRDKLSTIINNLSSAKASIIGLCLVFPREDEYSPKAIFSKLGVDAQNVIDYDKILSNSFRKSSVISGYIFDFYSKTIKGKIANISSIIVQKGYVKKRYLPEAKGIISNIGLLQESSLSSGFFNLIADEDGVTRSAPLLIRFKDSLYPSLSLEIVRNFLQKKEITVDYSKVGINTISLDNYVIPTDRFGRLMINFKGVSEYYAHISAKDIYSGNFKKEFIKNKIILIGASTSRFHDLRATPFDSTFSGLEVQANVIDNILNHDFLSKPNFIELLNIGLLFIIIFALVVFSMFGAVKNTILSIGLIFGFFVVAYFLFVDFGLLLNIFFPLLGSFILYSIFTSFDYINEAKLKTRINKQFIIELQNRHDIIQDEVTQKTEELQKRVQEKTVLLRELHHRVKNNLQLILSITRLQQHELKDKKMKEEFCKLQNRIKSIAKTHEILCNNEDISNVNMNEYISELCEEMESGFMQNNIKIDINVKANLPLKQAVYVGLVVNEIMSNSIKHAFGKDGGRIYIYLAKIKDEYILKIGDDGKGYEDNSAKNNSLGLKLVDTLVVSQLEGSIKLESIDRFSYVINFKVSE